MTKKKTVSKPVLIKIIYSTQMRSQDWRSSARLVAYAQGLLASQEFQALLGVLRNESPHAYGAFGGTHDDHIAHAYRGEGYALCLNTLESLATLATARPSLQAMFTPEAPTNTMPETQ